MLLNICNIYDMSSLLLFLGFFYLSVWRCGIYAHDHEGQKRVLDPQELELQGGFEPPNVSAGHQIQVLWKNSGHSTTEPSIQALLIVYKWHICLVSNLWL